MSGPIDTIREKADLFVPAGFRDEDGVWHDGPHRLELDAALTEVEHQLAKQDADIRTAMGADERFREQGIKDEALAVAAETALAEANALADALRVIHYHPEAHPLIVAFARAALDRHTEGGDVT